ncbi:hypothetical protein GF366_02245 [Candidatus Peregrinibacteria bacterium]|nr:hypothetical protein [Candidatus Peregrinibacteria bacterium]
MEDFHNILILMVVVWVMGKIFRYLTLPVIFGELIGGIIVGPMVLGLVDPDSSIINILAQLGIFFLMLHAGIETNPNTLLKGSKKSVLIALGGITIPFFVGFLTADAFGFSLYESLFIATSVSVTAIVISVRMLKDYKLKNTKFGHTIMSAALISDIVILVLFSIILLLVENGSVNPSAVIFMLGKILLFFGIVIWAGKKLHKYASRLFENKGFTLTLVLALFLGYVAEWIGLHVIIGAFMAGLFISEELIGTKIYTKIEDRIYGLSYGFLGPIFFTSLAFNLDFKGFIDRPELFLSFLAIAFIGKLMGAGGGALIQGIPKLRSFMIGVAMNSKGSVGLIIMTVGVQMGIIEKDIFSVLITVAFASTLITILLLKPLREKAIRKRL